jgi:hypothetical protein
VLPAASEEVATSEYPNISGDAEGNFALCDIAAGEELTEDYRHLRAGLCKAFLESGGARDGGPALSSPALIGRNCPELRPAAKIWPLPE